MTTEPPRDDTRIRFRDVPTRLPTTTHPDTDRLVTASSRWCRTHLRACARSDAELAAYLGGGISTLVCRMLPNAPHEVTLAACDLFEYLVLLDDAMGDRGRLGASEHAARHAAGRVMVALTDWGGYPDAATEGVYDAARRLRPHLSERQWERLAVGVADYLDGCVLEVAAGDDDLADLAAYTRRRRVTVGMRWILVLAELTAGGRLDPGVPLDPRVRELHTIALDHLWMVNDLFSYLKEWHGRECTTNVVPLLCRTRGHDPQGAVDWLFDHIAEREAAFLRAGREIESGMAAGRSAVPGYLHNIALVMSSALYWSRDTTRYHVPGLPDPRRRT
ncbi:terpene synthase family protein [Embleya hyalina]|uniref:Terpene synthase n=1 Tax=Embleya hyalina TaxID=516124 RepID=A0A401YM34_9ACTN|nr:terpene synthase family protein [Embleya hyalina]GCD95682.1 hypothetical protein EHYA_03357 [Embleya hyalina]